MSENSREAHVTRGCWSWLTVIWRPERIGHRTDIPTIFSLFTVQTVSGEPSKEALTVVLASDEGNLEQCSCNGGGKKGWVWDMWKANLTVQQMGYIQWEKEKNPGGLLGCRAEQLKGWCCYPLSCRRLKVKQVWGKTSSVLHEVTLRCLWASTWKCWTNSLEVQEKSELAI